MTMLDTIVRSFSAWPLAYGSVVAGLAGGVILAAQARTKDMRGAPTSKADLLARREALYAQLRELDDTRDRVDASLYQAERARLLAGAAEVLRLLDAEGVPSVTPASAAPGAEIGATPASATGGEAPSGPKSRSGGRFSDEHPRLTSALYGIAAALLVLGFKAGLDNYTHSRGEGESITGGGGGGMGAGGGGGMGGGGGQTASGGADEQGQPPVSAAEQAKLDAMKAKADAAPNDLELQNAYAHELINAGQVMSAWKVADAVSKIDKDNAEARVHQAVTLLSIGDVGMATKLLDKVLAAHPDQAEALGYRGMVYAQIGDRQGAIDAWTKAKAADPAQAATFDTLIAQVDEFIAQATGGGASAAQGGGSMGGGGAMGGSAGGGDVATGPAEFTGEITLASGVTATGGTLFIYVREAGVTAGPPLRVKRLPAQFPAKFTISASDSPMGGSLPAGPVQISARLDADGNVATKDPADPVAMSAPVTAGATGITLALTPAQ